MKKTASSFCACVLPKIFHLSVDYSKILEEMIFAGRYDKQNKNITGRKFSVKGKGTVEFEARYFWFFDSTCSELGVRAIRIESNNNPWLPAKIEHILAFGLAFPEEQIKYAIIGLGSVARVGKFRYVPALSSQEFERSLVLFRWSEKWCCVCHQYRFLAVRPVRK